MIEREGNHFWMPRQNRMDRAPQVADAFAVNDAHLVNAPFLTRTEIIRHELLHLTRLEGVQVQHAINRKLNWFIHRPNLPGQPGRKSGIVLERPGEFGLKTTNHFLPMKKGIASHFWLIFDAAGHRTTDQVETTRTGAALTLANASYNNLNQSPMPLYLVYRNSPATVSLPAPPHV